MMKLEITKERNALREWGFNVDGMSDAEVDRRYWLEVSKRFAAIAVAAKEAARAWDDFAKSVAQAFAVSLKAYHRASKLADSKSAVRLSGC
jgi:hypothetical protein